MAMNSKNPIEDPRTIYSLTMVLILYEFYKSEFLKGEDNLIRFIKIQLLILIATQLIFLLLCGISFAEYKDKKNLRKTSCSIYAIGFQSFVVIFLLAFPSYLTYIYFKSIIDVISNPWNVILSFIISFLIAIGVIYIRKEYFKTRPETDQAIYLIIMLWMFIYTAILVAG